MKYAVVTGTSRGLGHSIAMFFLEAGVHVIGISRNPAHGLKEIAAENNVTYQDRACDLSDLNQIESVVNQIVPEIYEEEPETVYLVNNAAMLEPINQAVNQTPEEVSKHVHVNTIAPMVLTNAFLKKGMDTDIPLIGMIITSGAANRPIYGWSAYCSSKASMNMYVQTVALEQKHLQTNHKIIAFSPGVMNTVMQEKIRNSSKEAFKDVEDFRTYKETGQLSQTEVVGSIIVDIMGDEATIDNGKIYDISDYV
ncbi:MAG TPA: (S)-benzoin forming benzil reductase [Bacillota bacterium]|nr:(S)-benzoin forming benzil reductase [Bacillota bacterium]